MKKQICIFLSMTLFMLAAGSLPAAADGQEEPVSVMVNGSQVEQKYNPIWNDAHTRIQIKPEFFADYFGAEISAKDGVTTISKNGHFITFSESEPWFIMDGIGGRNKESAYVVRDGDAYVPLRYMSEALGAFVKWNGNAAEVTIEESGLSDEAAAYLKGVTVFDQATIRLEGEKVIYIDPYRIAGEPHDADVILITHTHPDHLDIGSIKKLLKDSAAVLIAGETGEASAKENGVANVQSVLPGNEYTANGVTIKTIPAYNTSTERQNHRPEHNFVGYIVEANGVTYYAAGDTDYIEDMNGLDVDVAFLPMDGRFNMDEKEAARAANAIAPNIAVPYHYNNFSDESKARDFMSMLDEGITGVIMTFKMYGN